MKPFFVFLILFSFLLVPNLNEAIREPEEYWKKVMKNEPVPEPIKEFLNNPFRTKHKKFINNFNTKASVLIYHNPTNETAP